MNFKDVFYYDETSPSCLRWAVNVPYRGLFAGCTFKRQIGDVAGTLHNARKDYYRWKVKYQQKVYMAHRVIWEIHNGPIPEGMMVDHKDGDATNNKIENLRIVSQTVNARNTKKRKNNKTGSNGVSLICVNGYEYYVSTYTLNGKGYNKHFSVLKYGEELAKFMAEEHRLHQIDLLNLSGAGYTERHGKEE